MRTDPLAKNPTFLTVVAAAIRDGDGRLLMQQRPPGKRHGGLWEFPGGKVEIGEIPQLALCREVEEELGIVLSPEGLAPAGFAEQAAEADRPALVLLLYTCPRWTGAPEAREGQHWGWFGAAEAGGLPLPPMDRALLAKLCP